MGRRRILQASTVASSRGRPWLWRMLEKSTIRMLLETTMPVIMMVPISDMMLRVAAGEEQQENHADDAGRDGHEDDEGIDEGSELGHEDEVDKNNGKKQAEAEVVEGLVHADDCAVEHDAGVLVGFGVGDEVADVLAGAAQRLRFRGDIDVDDTADLVVVDFGGRVDELDVGHRAQRCVAGAMGAGPHFGLHVAGVEGDMDRAVAGGMRRRAGGCSQSPAWTCSGSSDWRTGR